MINNVTYSRRSRRDQSQLNRIERAANGPIIFSHEYINQILARVDDGNPHVHNAVHGRHSDFPLSLNRGLNREDSNSEI